MQSCIPESCLQNLTHPSCFYRTDKLTSQIRWRPAPGKEKEDSIFRIGRPGPTIQRRTGHKHLGTLRSYLRKVSSSRPRTPRADSGVKPSLRALTTAAAVVATIRHRYQKQVKMDSYRCPEELAALYRLLDQHEIQATADLRQVSKEVELDLMRHVHAIWDNDLIEPLRHATLRKFAVYVDAPVTNLVVKHSASYADFSFFVTQAIRTTKPSEHEHDLTGRGEQTLPVRPNDWISLKTHVLPKSFVETLQLVRPAVESGTALVLPTSLDGRAVAGVNASYTWPVARDSTTIDINLTRFREVDPLLYGGETPVGYLPLRVPTLTGVPLETVLKVRRDEQEAFNRFTRRFFGMVKDHEDSLESEQALVRAMEEVEDAVRQLEDRLAQIRRSRVLSSIEASVTFGVSCLCLFMPAELAEFVAALFGGKAGRIAFTAFGSYRESIDELKQDDFYVPWLLAQELND